MATHQAIAATSNALRLLLEHAAASSADWTGASVRLVQAPDLQQAPEATRPGLAVYLHRVVLSTVRRDRGPRIALDGVRYRPSIPLDLHFLVTARSRDARTAHQLLGWAIRVLEDTPVLPAALLNAYRAGVPVFADDETVELAWEPLSVTDLSDVWQVAQAQQGPAASYRARMVCLDSDVPLADGGVVRERELRYAGAPA